MIEQQRLRESSSPNNFGVEMRYAPGFLHHLLTQDNKSHDFLFDNNWQDISEEKYDPFNLLYAGVCSDLKIKSQPDWGNRSTKVFWFEASLIRYDGPFKASGWGERIREIQDELLKIGEKTEVEKNRSFSERTFLKGGETSRQIWTIDPSGASSSHSRLTPWLLPRSKEGYVGYVSKIRLFYPYLLPPTLNSLSDISGSLAGFTGIFEKLVRTLYKIDGKNLPLKKLIFAPTILEKEKGYWKTCDYCASSFLVINNITNCPQCGGHNPI